MCCIAQADLKLATTLLYHTHKCWECPSPAFNLLKFVTKNNTLTYDLSYNLHLSCVSKKNTHSTVCIQAVYLRRIHIRLLLGEISVCQICWAKCYSVIQVLIDFFFFALLMYPFESEVLKTTTVSVLLSVCSFSSADMLVLYISVLSQ